MHILSIRQLHKHFGNKTLFENADLTTGPNERIGVVGVNGSGKTTLLRMIADLEAPDAGTIDRNPNARLAYLPQNPEMADEMTVLDYLFQGESPTLQLLHDYEQAILALAHNPNDTSAQKQATTMNQRMDIENGWAAEANAKAVLTRLGLSEFEAPLGTLSGGQRRRAAMARALIDPADLLILDEPTNHIDTDTIMWLEDYLADLKTALLLVTHDRYFLDRVVNRIIEIEGGQIFSHSGNYSDFLADKAGREAGDQKAEHNRRAAMKRELDWLNRTPMARGSKQKARIQRAEAMQEQGFQTQGQDLSINVASRRTGKQIMEISHISKRFGDLTTVDDFSYVINRRARLGIIGPNGAGKSTLLNIIAGRLVPDSGEITMGTTIKIGYYDQESMSLDESQRVVDYISRIAEVIETASGTRVTAAQMLIRFQFPHAMQYSYISTLSGGERRRLYLLQTLMMAPNFLMLDEPTNDLDIQTLSILEDYLETFDGVLIVVSHDRYFLDRTAEHIFAFEGGGRITQYPGNFSAYQARKAAMDESESGSETKNRPAQPKPQPKPSSTRPRKLSFKEKRELEALEAKIESLEGEQASLTEQINHIGADYQRLQTLTESLSQVEADLGTAFERWAELSEIEEN